MSLVTVPPATPSPITTQDDLIVGGASGVPTRLGKGSDGQVLTVDPTTHHLLWATPSGGGSALTVEEADGSPTDNAVTKIVFPNDSLSIASHVATVRQVPYGFIGCSVSGNSTGLSSSYASLAFNSADTYDTDNFHDPSSNNTRLTIPAGLGGKYMLSALCALASGGGSDHRLAYRVNGGSEVLLDRQWVNDGGSAFYVNFSTQLSLAAGDYVEIRVLYDGNGTSTVYHAELTKLDAGRVGSGIGCKATTTSASIPNSTFTAVPFDSEDLDTDGFHSISSNTSRVTIPAGLGGKYLVIGHMTTPNNGTGIRYTLIYKNGTVVSADKDDAGSASGGYDFQRTTSTVLDLVPGDYIELFLYQNSGGSLTYGNCELMVMRLDSLAGPAATAFSGVCSADTNIGVATFTDITGCSMDLQAGTYLFWGHATVSCPNATVGVAIRITDGTNVYAAVEQDQPNGGYYNALAVVSGPVVLTSVTTIKLQAYSSGGSAGSARTSLAVAGGANQATRITALKIA